MNEMHLEQPDPDVDVKTALAELTVAVGELTAEQELRQLALGMAIQVFLKPNRHEYDDVIKLAEDFYRFLSNPGSDG